MTTRSPLHLGLALGILLACSTPALAALPTIQFDTPAQANGTVDLNGLAWALLIFHPSSAAQFDMDLQPLATLNRSFVAVDIHNSGTRNGTSLVPIPSPSESIENDFRAGMAFSEAWSSLYIEATSIQLQAADTEALLSLPDGRTVIREYQPERRVPLGTADGDLIPPTGLLWAIDSSDLSANIPVSVQAQGIRRMQWHNATIECPGEVCLDGAKDYGTASPIPGGWIGSRVMSIREVASSGGTMTGNGTPWSVVVGGSTLTADLDGWLRLPKANVSGQCNEAPCANPDGRTLQVQGQIHLRDMRPLDGERRVISQFATGSAVARIDESSTFKLTAGPAWALAAVSGAAGLLVLFGRPLLGLFARNTRPLLEHPRAKAIHDLVHATPGISFGQVREGTGWGHGTVHYHLKRLLKAGLIVAYTYRNSVRYYENHGRHKNDWMEHAALRKPELEVLHGWIAEHPSSSQVDIINAAKAWGWKRSTIQDRLGQLREADLVKVQRDGASVAYFAVRPSGLP